MKNSILLSMTLALATQACATDPTPTRVDESDLVDVPATQATTAATNIISWHFGVVDDDYISRGLDKNGGIVSELHLRLSSGDGGLTLRDSRTNGLLRLDGTGAIIINTLPRDTQYEQMYEHARADFDAYRKSAESAKFDCAVWIVAIFAGSIGAGAGCLPCAAGVIAAVGAAALDC